MGLDRIKLETRPGKLSHRFDHFQLRSEGSGLAEGKEGLNLLESWVVDPHSWEKGWC